MPYIGNPPAERFTSFAYQDLTGGSGTSFTLDNAVGNPQEIEVFVNNVRQEPGVAYTVSGTALTMTGSIATTDDFYVVFQGKAIQTATHPSDRALTATDGTFTGDLTVDTNTLHVDAANNRVGVGDAAPSRQLVVKDTSGNCDVLIEGGNSNASQLLFGDQDAEVRGYVSYNHSFDRLRLGAGGSDRASLDGDGLKFGSDTAAANALDDAEYGSWTATLTGSASAPSTAVTTTGNYRKIGRLVFVECRFANVNTTGASGTCYVTGFPYPSVATFAGGDVMSQYTLNVNATAANVAPFFANSTTLQFQQTRQSIATWVAASITAGAGRYLYMSMTYPTSS